MKEIIKSALQVIVTLLIVALVLCVEVALDIVFIIGILKLISFFYPVVTICWANIAIGLVLWFTINLIASSKRR